MFGGFFDKHDGLLEAGAKARWLHAAWLSRALQSGGRGLPRIPTRRVSDGGFGGLLRTPEGRAWAAEWWASAWSRLDDE